MRTLLFVILGMLLIVQINVQAQGVTKTGTTAAGFLGIDIGPRGTAMGSAYVSVANDVSAMYWNPAGIARIDGFEASFTNTKWIADLSLNYAGAVLPLGDVGNIGINATFLTMDQIERTTIAQPDGTGGVFRCGLFCVWVEFRPQPDEPVCHRF